MANALTSDFADLRTNAIHQFLHGYSDGHRLIEGSLKLPNDLARLVLRMSDLSGNSVVRGFEHYITGYPLDSGYGYALAKTWYASEMPRPGCVWTHTLVLPTQIMTTVPALWSLTRLFKKPMRDSIRGQYTDPLSVHDFAFEIQHKEAGDSINHDKLNVIFFAYYGRPRFGPVILAARDSGEFADAIFALWSQQWPSLRQQFAFCTGSLSARNLPDRAFDVQCTPSTVIREVAREIVSDSLAEPVLILDKEDVVPEELMTAVNDAEIAEGGPFRKFLWSVADLNSKRSDLASYVKLFDAFNGRVDAPALIELIAETFPQPSAGAALKARLVASSQTDRWDDFLRALATTDKYASFDPALLAGTDPPWRTGYPSRTRLLVNELFRSNLNPLGDALLAKIVHGLSAEEAQQIVKDQPQLLPAVFRANAELAASSFLWSLAGDRKRELLDSLMAQDIRPELISQIVYALLDTNSDRFIQRVVERWGRNAIFATLDWVENHQGAMSEICRGALRSYVPEVMSWVELRTRSVAGLVAAAHVVAPYTYQIASHDSTVWLSALDALQASGNELEATYIRTLLLALGLCNAPPAPLHLIEESFEIIYRKAESQQLNDDAWVILQPLVPELHWWNNWDWCERMRRALLLAFMRYSWPAHELKERIRNRRTLREVLDRVREVNGKHYFHNVDTR